MTTLDKLYEQNHELANLVTTLGLTAEYFEYEFMSCQEEWKSIRLQADLIAKQVQEMTETILELKKSQVQVA
jgi:hypothetical protein